MFLESLDNDDYGFEFMEQNEPGMVAEPEVGFDIAMESAAQWHNIELAMLRAEHAAIVTENRALLEEAKDGFWDKVVGWFKDLWNRMKQFWTNIRSMLMNLMGSHITWLNKNEKRLREIAAEDPTFNETIQGYNFEAKSMSSMTIVGNFIAAQVGKIESSTSKEEISTDDFKRELLKELDVKVKDADLNAFGSELHKAVRGGRKEKESVKIAAKDIEMYIRRLRDSGKRIANVESVVKTLSSTVERGIKIAEAESRAGASYMDSGMNSLGSEKAVEQKTKAAEVKSRKNLLVVVQVAATTCVNAIREMQLQDFAALKLVLRKGKGKDESFTGRTSRRYGGNILDSFA